MLAMAEQPCAELGEADPDEQEHRDEGTAGQRPDPEEFKGQVKVEQQGADKAANRPIDSSDRSSPAESKGVPSAWRDIELHEGPDTLLTHICNYVPQHERMMRICPARCP